MPQNIGTISSLWCGWHNFIHASCFLSWSAYTMGWFVVATCATCGFLIQAYWSPLINARPISSFTFMILSLIPWAILTTSSGCKVLCTWPTLLSRAPTKANRHSIIIYLLCTHDMFRIDWACFHLNFSMSSL